MIRSKRQLEIVSFHCSGYTIIKLGTLTNWMKFSAIPEWIQTERFIPVESFRKKGKTFRGISFFSLLPEFLEISVPFVHTYSAMLLTVILPRKNAYPNYLKGGGRFPKRLSLQCVILLVGSVGGRFRTQLQLCRWKRNKFCGRHLCFAFYLHDSGFQRASGRLRYIEWKQCGCWLLVSLMKCGCCSSRKKKLSPSPKI